MFLISISSHLFHVPFYYNKNYFTSKRADTIVANDANDQKILMSQQQQLEQLQQLHHSMSCYVCSTMDYENPADNLCRVMKHHHRSPSGLHNQPNMAHTGFLSNPMMNFPTQTTTPTSPTSPTSPTRNTMLPSSPEALVSSAQHSSMSPYDDSSSVQLETSSTPSSLSRNLPLHNYNNNLSHEQTDDTQLVNPSTNLTLNQQQVHSQQKNSLLPVHHGPYPQVQHRVLPPGNYIRSRPCLEDENFCSIVSVVRIEFINDNLVSRFWAMER